MAAVLAPLLGFALAQSLPPAGPVPSGMLLLQGQPPDRVELQQITYFGDCPGEEQPEHDRGCEGDADVRDSYPEFLYAAEMPVIDAAYPLDETPRAIGHVATGRARGTVVVAINPATA
jgi:hypothetical protein